MKPAIAKLLGRVLQPAIPGFVVAFKAGLDWQGGLTAELLEATVSISLAAIGVPLLALYLGNRLGLTPNDLWVDRRENRRFFYPALGVGILLSAALFHWLYPYELGMRMAIVAGVVLIPMAIANEWLKVSIHTAGNAGIATAATWIYGAWAAPLFVLVPLVAWARLTSGHHTKAEVYTGALIGIVGTALVLAFT